jgi:hypothetical protein
MLKISQTCLVIYVLLTGISLSLLQRILSEIFRLILLRGLVIDEIHNAIFFTHFSMLMCVL